MAKKRDLHISKESILAMMQEIYNELVEQRNTAIRIQNKMLIMLKDPEDMQTIGPVIEKQQKIINDVVEKKLSLAKLQTSIWDKSSEKKEDFNINDIDDDVLNNLLSKDINNISDGDKPYTLK